MDAKNNIHLVLYVVGLVCFALGAANVPSRVSWTPLGLFFLTLTLLV